MVKGIYLAKIYFTDLSEYKIRPPLAPYLLIWSVTADWLCVVLSYAVFLCGNMHSTSGDVERRKFILFFVKKLIVVS